MSSLKTKLEKMDSKTITTDVLIIGGGTAGCYTAIRLAENSDLKITIVDRAWIKRSGCLAAGVNALNAYIGPGESADDYLEYIKSEFNDVVREDLVYSIAQRLRKIVRSLDELGLPILKDENGNYTQRGKRSIKINGENIKPLLADAVFSKPQIEVMENTYVSDLIKIEKRVCGAVAFEIGGGVEYKLFAKAVVCTTGGAAGIYKPNNSGEKNHKMWYPPFNCGSGYAFGIRNGAEMTTFEMRFIALRCKNTIAPTGTIAQGIHSKQVNKYGVEYVQKYGEDSTINRLYATVQENLLGNGPCVLNTQGISNSEEMDLYKAYLNMAPMQVLDWLGTDKPPSKFNVEIEGTEPYIVGGHGASGYWVDVYRRTTLKGLYAAGDVCGGSPKKYVTGCMAEADIAAETIIRDLEGISNDSHQQINIDFEESNYDKYMNYTLDIKINQLELDRLESQMQTIMDEHAGGISKSYIYDYDNLMIAKYKLELLGDVVSSFKVQNTNHLAELFDLRDRLLVSEVLIEHLLARKETRWKCYQSNKNYNEVNDDYNCFINSKVVNGKIKIFKRPLVSKEDVYEHNYR